jgi:PAS domain-containing protein
MKLNFQQDVRERGARMPKTGLGYATLQKDTRMIQSRAASSAKGSSAPVPNAVTPPPAKAIDAGDSSRAPIQIWTGKAVREQIHSKSLENAYRQWLYHRATRQPRLRDMYLKESNSFDDTLLNLKVGDQHVVVSQSDSYIREVGRDLRGVLSSEMKFATANSLRDIFDDSLARKAPVYARYISSLSEQNVYWETLVLPLAADERSDPIFTMCYMAMLSEKVDVLQILYDRSPVGIIAAVPIMDGHNKTDDARILTMNNKARQILKQEGSRLALQTVGDMIHYLHNGLKWSAIGTASQDQVTRIDYHDPANQRFSMMIELINQFVLISLAERDQPEVKTANRFARLLGLD